MSEPNAIACFKVIREAFRDHDSGTSELTAQMLVAMRDFLRQKESAKRLEEMTVYDIIALVDPSVGGR